MTNAQVYYDDSSDPSNPGWVCETDEGQFKMETTDPDATSEELFRDAQSFADGLVIIDYLKHRAGGHPVRMIIIQGR